MQKVKAISLVIIGVFLALLTNHLLAPKIEFDKEILRTPIFDSQILVGYRNNTGNTTTGFSYYFYIKSNGSEKLPSPFLITDTPNIKFLIKKNRQLSFHVDGKVYQFTNNIWINNQDKLIPISFEFFARNTPSD
ncbi:hypothetical protein [Plesiomonas sp.]|uniref:hypothetical protein n=1 Tax=Plesiomonas sp. TaxID=2486279 RepID=UPI003F2B29AF